MIKRIIGSQVIKFLSLYPVVTLTGPRQSGKTTLLKDLLPDYDYFTLEDPEVRKLALDDPRKFLEIRGKGMIIDEAQRAPELFSYIQGIVDKEDRQGMYVLSGSQNFLLLENISQTLAGRVAILKLLPLSFTELSEHGLIFNTYEEIVFSGFYPRLFDKNIRPGDYYPFYLQTYIERDVRLIRNISNQGLFIRFIKLVAGRAGQIVNIAGLATDCGISPITAKSWLSILEASFIVYQLQPHHKNFNKRLIKNPKYYFYDTGLLCFLLGIDSSDQLSTHYALGAIFENFIITEFLKGIHNRVKQPGVYFWLDKHKKEIDLLLDRDQLTPIEIKAGKTFNTSFLDQISYWNSLSGNQAENAYLIYGGDKDYNTSKANVVSWRNLNKLIDTLI